MFNRYMQVAFPTGTPEWTNINTVVYKGEDFLLRLFRRGKGDATLVVPPQAGHSSHIADYDTGQSLIGTVLETTKGPVYCIEWLSATKERRGESIDDLVSQLGIAFRYTGPANLIGLCQGGWLATIYTALYPKDVKSLTCVAAPIDFHKGGGHIYDSITSTGMKPYRDIVAASGGVQKGDMMLLSWKLMHPVERFLGDYMDIWTDILLGNKERLKKTERFRTWYEYTQDLAGVWYLEACEKLFLNNSLVKGELIVHGRTVSLKDITCSVAMIAGGADEITLESHLFALKDYVSSLDTLMITIPDCGHVGCFMGTKSQAYIADALRWIGGI